MLVAARLASYIATSAWRSSVETSSPWSGCMAMPIDLLVAHRVVDLLEAIEVDEQQRREGAFALRGGKRALAELVELAAVGEVGERIVRGLMAQPPRGARDRAVERGPQREQAAHESEDEDARVGGDRARRGPIVHVGLEDAAADRHVHLDEAALRAEL